MTNKYIVFITHYVYDESNDYPGNYVETTGFKESLHIMVETEKEALDYCYNHNDINKTHNKEFYVYDILDIENNSWITTNK